MGLSSLQAQVVTEWQMHEGNEGIVDFRTSSHGDPAAYTQISIPDPNDEDWEAAPLDDNGQVSISRRSGLRCKQQLDFLYFQTEVNVPKGMEIDEFNISYDKADDGARIYFFNSKHPNGHFNPKADLVLGGSIGSVNLKDEIVAGEVNRVVIVQYDNCATGNNIQGIRIKVNGTEVEAGESILDMCGNEYTTMQFGNQIWLQENLRAPACSSCPEITSIQLGNHPSRNQEFYVFDKPLYAHYNNNENDLDPVTQKPLGALFNFAAIEACNVCPEGFRIPSTRDWEKLMTTIKNDAKVLRTRDAENDNKPFMYIAGRADAYGSVVRGRFVQFWSTDTDKSAEYKANAFYLGSTVKMSPEDKRLGLYVRCVKSATPEIPDQFKLHAYSINGKRELGNYWMGWYGQANWAQILTGANADQAKIMSVKKVTADDVKDIVYLQVENFGDPGKEYYLTIDRQDGNKVKIAEGQSPLAKFRVKPALQTETPDSDYVSFESIQLPNFYLRHMGYKMYVSEATEGNLKNKVYLEDASWLFQKL
ncbi:FISUMP domain-containing protein [Lewinella sp. W8]|uniref:FISUMP domain-containing protein n=1 Tax=Lewinella sp. W8 TaxID=2528208 RepID=UPI001564DFF2|nr:FISUMP domain-containing protein [Lewinella sp. W8]